MIKTAKPRLTSEQAVTRFLAQLPAMSHKELRQHWRELFDREPNTGKQAQNDEIRRLLTFALVGAGPVAPVRNLFGIKSQAPMLMPGLAQPAIQEGKYVADVIRRRVAGRPQPKPFWYWDKGDLAIVGRTYAVADLKVCKICWLPSVGPLGSRAYLLSRWICQSPFRVAAMGTCFPDETSSSTSIV
jgi:hypothetical protein